MDFVKSTWQLIVIVTFIITSTVSIIGFFETKASAEIRYVKFEKRITKVELQSARSNQIICATAIDLNWPTVKKACGVSH